ncbi:MAG: hypothetical protein ACK5PP_08435 [Acidimicrobiales bacterium]
MTALIDPIRTPPTEDDRLAADGRRSAGSSVPAAPAGTEGPTSPPGVRPVLDPGWASRVADHGVAILTEPELTALVMVARRSGASEVLIDVVADPDAPVVARQRAFGRIATVIAGRTGLLDTDRPRR